MQCLEYRRILQITNQSSFQDDAPTSEEERGVAIPRAVCQERQSNSELTLCSRGDDEWSHVTAQYRSKLAFSPCTRLETCTHATARGDRAVLPILSSRATPPVIPDRLAREREREKEPSSLRSLSQQSRCRPSNESVFSLPTSSLQTRRLPFSPFFPSVIACDRNRDLLIYRNARAHRFLFISRESKTRFSRITCYINYVSNSTREP